MSYRTSEDRAVRLAAQSALCLQFARDLPDLSDENKNLLGEILHEFHCQVLSELTASNDLDPAVITAKATVLLETEFGLVRVRKETLQ